MSGMYTVVIINDDDSEESYQFPKAWQALAFMRFVVIVERIFRRFGR